MSWEHEINGAQADIDSASAARNAINQANYWHTELVWYPVRRKKLIFFNRTKYKCKDELKFRGEDYNRDVKNADQNVDDAKVKLNLKIQQAQELINNMNHEINLIDSELSTISGIVDCDIAYNQDDELLNNEHIGLKCDGHILKRDSAASKLHNIVRELTDVQRLNLFVKLSSNPVNDNLLNKILNSDSLIYIVNHSIDNDMESLFNDAVNKGFNFSDHQISEEKFLRFLINKKSKFLKDFLENLTDFKCIKHSADDIIDINKDLLVTTNKSGQILLNFIIMNCSNKVAKKAICSVNIKEELIKIANQDKDGCDEALFQKIIDLDSEVINVHLAYKILESTNSYLARDLLTNLIKNSDVSFDKIKSELEDLRSSSVGSSGKRVVKEFDKIIESITCDRDDNQEGLHLDHLIGDNAHSGEFTHDY